MIDQLLALALADEARQGVHLVPVNLETAVSDLVLRMLPRADSAGVDLGVEGLDGPEHVLGTVALLEGLLSNLIDNALRYGRPTDPGTCPRVTVRAERLGADKVLLTVSDNGPGMQPEHLASARDRWAQGRDGVRLGSGTGLGLAIVTRYAGLLGGSLALLPASAGTGLQARVSLVRAAVAV
jgi:two-component system sensor histidine kinase TctE